jgi:hypothetical protein
MSRISMKALCTAIEKIRAMNMAQKEQVLDELFQKQPNMLNSFLPAYPVDCQSTQANSIFEA